MPGARGQTVAFSRSEDGTAVPRRAVFAARAGSAAGLAPRAGRQVSQRQREAGRGPPRCLRPQRWGA